MKVTEALKDKKVNIKRVANITKQIQMYSSITSIEKPAFESEKRQREEVKSLVQSAIDLLNYRAKIKMLIDKSNVNTKIQIPKGIVTPAHELSIAEARMFQFMYNEYLLVYNALNKNTSERKRNGVQITADGTKVYDIQLFDEMWKNNSIKDLEMKYHHIDKHLDMLNVTTDLPE